VLSHIRASAFGPCDFRKQRPIQAELPVPLLEARREWSGDRPAADRRDDLTASRRPNGISKSVHVFALVLRGEREPDFHSNRLEF
jgi:hypothetical protein